MTRVWSNKKINSHSKANSDLGDDIDMKNHLILDTDNDTDLRKEARFENQNELSNVKIFIENKLYKKR